MKKVRFANEDGGQLATVEEVERVGETSVREYLEYNSARKAARRELRRRAQVEKARNPTELQSAWARYLREHPSHAGLRTFQKNIRMAKKGRMTPYVASQQWKTAYSHE